jgi:hypothetical protein
MRRNVLAFTAMAAAAFMLFGAHAKATEFHAVLSGFEEVGALPSLNTSTSPPTITGPTGAIFSTGTATLDLNLNETLQMITYTLTYSGLSAPIRQAHIHLGKRHVPGGVMVFFCTNLGNGPSGTPVCPSPSGTVTGQIIGASVVGPTAQNVSAGDFDALLAALTSDTAYANIHTNNFPSGEIRGQIRRPDRDKH